MSEPRIRRWRVRRAGHALTKKQFLNAAARGRVDVVQVMLDVLDEAKARYCVIGGLALIAYAEPVVSPDLDISSWPPRWRRSATGRRRAA